MQGLALARRALDDPEELWVQDLIGAPVQGVNATAIASSTPCNEPGERSSRARQRCVGAVLFVVERRTMAVRDRSLKGSSTCEDHVFTIFPTMVDDFRVESLLAEGATRLIDCGARLPLGERSSIAPSRNCVGGGGDGSQPEPLFRSVESVDPTGRCSFWAGWRGSIRRWPRVGRATCLAAGWPLRASMPGPGASRDATLSIGATPWAAERCGHGVPKSCPAVPA